MWPIAAVSAKHDEMFELVDICTAKTKERALVEKMAT